MTFAAVDEIATPRWQRAGAILGAMYGRDMRSAAARYCIAGTADDCRAAAQQFAAAGVEHLILTPLATATARPIKSARWRRRCAEGHPRV